MSNRFGPMRGLLAAALALSVAPAFAGDNIFSNTWFFGDSLTDSGYFRPYIISQAGPNGALVGRFTTNPGLVWSEYMANYFGTNADPALGFTGTDVVAEGGTNYAIGGARVGTDAPGNPSLSMNTQLAMYLSTNTVDPDALYTVWGGANDIFAVTDPTTAPTIIGQAVGSEVGIVSQLEAAGAKYVMVATVPDIGLTPAYAGPNSVLGTQLTTSYNDALFSSLAAAGLRVIPLDTFHLLQEIVSNPGLYGFTNTTTPACGAVSSQLCSPLDYVAPDVSGYVFADGVHPTTTAHAVVANYAISMIEGPRQIAALPVSADAVGRARAETVFGHATGVQGDGMRWWGDVRGDFQHSGSEQNAFGGGGPALTGGVDWRRGALAYGVFGGIGRQGIDWGHDSGDFDQTDATLGGFVGWNGAHGWVAGQLSYTNLDFDTHREIVLGTATRKHDGSPGGSNITAGVQAGWTFGDGAFRNGPVLGLLSQTIKVDGFDESDATLSTSLSYPDQKFDSLIGSIGWQASYAINDRVQPYARVAWNRQFEDAPEEAFATSQTLGTAGEYAVPGLSQDKDYATLLVGARTHVAGFDASFGVTGTVGQDSADDASAFVTIGRGF